MRGARVMAKMGEGSRAIGQCHRNLYPKRMEGTKREKHILI